MTQGEDFQGLRKVIDLSRWISIALLILHFYYSCYSVWVEWGIHHPVVDRILAGIQRTGLFDGGWRCKGIILGFLGLTLLGTKARKDPGAGYRMGLQAIGTGLLFFFASEAIFDLHARPAVIACWYMGVTAGGYLLIMTGGTWLSRVIGASWRKQVKKKVESGFRQEQRLIKTDYSINFEAQYTFEGINLKSHINIVNARRGVLVIGSPGAGKSRFIIEPAISQLVSRGMSLFVLDAKYPALSKHVYREFRRYRASYSADARFYCINFTDLTTSHRCNVIDPATIEHLSDAIGISRTILLGMNRSWANQEGDFFVESPISFLAAIIWYLKMYKKGLYCTLPHAIELAQAPYEHLFTLLNAEADLRVLVNPFIQAYSNQTMKMLDSQISSAKIPLGRLASKDLYYILTGNDLLLDINDPKAPKILCLGGDPARQEALAPILSLYIDRMNKMVNKPGKHPCALIYDEFGTVRASSVLNTVAVGRSNNIISLLAVQDINQLRMRYSKAEADLIMNMTGNLVCGQVGGETARWVSERFPSATGYRSSISVNSNDLSVGRSEQQEATVSPATIANLSSGEFVGIVGDDPDVAIELKAFHATIIRELALDSGKGSDELPVVATMDADVLQAHFLRIKQEILDMVDEEVNRISGDPQLAGYAVSPRP